MSRRFCLSDGISSLTSYLEGDVAIVSVRAGACGFVTRIRAERENNRREVRIEIESDCESVQDLGFVLEQLGLLGMKDVISTNPEKNQVFRAASDTLPHAACPVPVAIIKVSEVALGLNVPSPVTIEFQCGSGGETAC
jgi:hypothetical protein